MNFARRYETVTLVHPESGPEGWEKVLGRIREALGKTDGQEVRVEDWGRRKLAYKLRRSKCTKAHYMYMQYVGSNTTVAEVERLLKITEPAMMWQTIVLDTRLDLDTFDFAAAAGESTSQAKKAAERAEAAAAAAARAEALAAEAAVAAAAAPPAPAPAAEEPAADTAAEAPAEADTTTEEA